MLNVNTFHMFLHIIRHVYKIVHRIITRFELNHGNAGNKIARK